jgi:prepilin-type N-terminal cleavage/methylation domain-containing protein
MSKTIRNMLSAAGRAARPARSGFTLLELLIAVGALALVSAGVAAIFEATGRTVQTGKRVSAMAASASLIERQMRQDFAAMTRDGFLVIKNMYATANGDAYPTGWPLDTTDAVPLNDSDERARLRRTDEIMFFVKGQYVSVRDLIDGRYVAAADSAAVYYGHGQRGRKPQAYSATDSYYNPSVNDGNGGAVDMNARLGFKPPAGIENPNLYASDWILMRQLSLLRPPQTSPSLNATNARPISVGATGYNVTDQHVLDSDIQVGLQPAASNLFRSLANLFPTGPSAPANSLRSGFDSPGNANAWLHPLRPSGLVDLVTTDLAEVRAIVMSASVFPGQAGARFFTASNNNGPDASNPGVDGKWRIKGPTPFDDQIINRQQAWMDDALPAWSDSGVFGGSVNLRTRMRCEAAPVNYVGVLSDGLPGNNPELPCRRADQLMLSASNFLPHCTEFIVEWSFGMQYTSDPNDANYISAKAGQLVWYGMPRFVNGDMVANEYEVPNQVASPQPSRFPYPWTTHQPQPFTRVDGTTGSHDLQGRVVHSQNLDPTADPGRPVTSYFGYTDPTFDPEFPTALEGNPGSTHNGLLDLPTESRTPTIPWAWPKFIRITMSLADPNNPTVEQSFQFVFEVPAAAR